VSVVQSESAERMRFSCAITPTADDIDNLGHVSNVVYVRWLQEVGVAHSDATGWTWPRYQEFGAVFVVRRHEIDYLLPAKLGDVLTATTWIESMRAVSCLRRTEIFRSDGQRVVSALTTWAMVGLTSAKPAKIPAEIRQLFVAGAI
jgi:acyl-CoA thioester hydrolase